jgi:hypothetical protein
VAEVLEQFGFGSLPFSSDARQIGSIFLHPFRASNSRKPGERKSKPMLTEPHSG